MKSLIFLVLLVVCLHGSLAGLHSLKYFYSAPSEVPNFPEFMIDGLIDDVQVFHFDSNIRRVVPKQDWMDKVTADDPYYLDRYTENYLGHQLWFKDNFGMFKKLLNLTEGVHIGQMIYGCEWDDETGDIKSSFNKVRYDGKDLMSFDVKTESWIVSKPQAFFIKLVLDQHTALKEAIKTFFTEECPYYVKKFVDCGRSSLMRIDRPSVSLLQKNSSSPVRCFATGFYPKTASLFWRRDGVEIHEDVEPGEILPNQDGTFQMSVDLDVLSVKAEDWGRLDCVFQLSGVKEDMVTRLEKEKIRTNWVPESSYAVVIGVVVGLLVLLVVIVGLIAWRRNWHHSVNQYLRVLVRNSNGPSTEQSAESRV